MSRPTIVCYGDSNTWGRDPHSTRRHPDGDRWPDALAEALGPERRVIAEGLNGRTTVWDDPIEEGRCGKTYLLPCLLSHHPLELVILMLGTNDLKKRFSVSPFDIGRSIGLLLDMVLRSGTGPNGGLPAVLLLCPPPVGRMTEFAEMFEGAQEKSHRLAQFYRMHADQRGVSFFDTAEAIRASDGDGLHLDAGEHRKLGTALAPLVERILSSS